MIERSKFIALKNYIPIGLPTENDFLIKEKEIYFKYSPSRKNLRQDKKNVNFSDNPFGKLASLNLK